MNLNISTNEIPLVGNDDITWENQGLKIIEELPNITTFNSQQRSILRELYRKDVIPDKYRKDIWMIASGAKLEMVNHKHYYDNLVYYFPDFIPLVMEKQITLDVRRTFLKKEEINVEDKEKRLKTILLSYSKRNINVGYCQGFNFIVGYLLDIFSNDEEVFWLFTTIIDNIFPPDYFVALCGVMADTNMLIELIKRKYPNFNEQHQIYFSNTIVRFLSTLFTKTSNKSTINLILDAIFLDGIIAAYNIVLYFADLLMKFNESLEVPLTLENMIHYNDDTLSNLSYTELTAFRKEIFKDNPYKDISLKAFLNERKKMVDIQYKEVLDICKVKHVFEENNDDLIMNSYINNVNQCNLDWPLCIYDRQYRFEHCECFIYKVLDEPVIIDDYFTPDKPLPTESKIVNINLNEDEEQFEKYRDLIIQRRKHICKEKEEKRIRNNITNRSIMKKEKDIAIAQSNIFENNNEKEEKIIYAIKKESNIVNNIENYLKRRFPNSKIDFN